MSDDHVVKLSGQAHKSLAILMRDSKRKTVVEKVKTLIEELKLSGAVRGNWPNYSKLGNGIHHCHLKKGKPCYVAVWREDNGVIIITYIGTHEKAPY